MNVLSKLLCSCKLHRWKYSKKGPIEQFLTNSFYVSTTISRGHRRCGVCGRREVFDITRLRYIQAPTSPANTLRRSKTVEDQGIAYLQELAHAISVAANTASAISCSAIIDDCDAAAKIASDVDFTLCKMFSTIKTCVKNKKE